jgi:hypothetical protein
MQAPVLCLVVVALALQGCDDDGSPSPPASQASLSVSWAGDPMAGSEPLQVVLVAPADAQPAFGRVRDPTRAAGLFRYEADDLRGYTLSVYRGNRQL